MGKEVTKLDLVIIREKTPNLQYWVSTRAEVFLAWNVSKCSFMEHILKDIDFYLDIPNDRFLDRK